MQRCPPEIWSEILGHLDVDNNDGHNLATIKACTLLFKSLVPIAQAEVFRNINISHPRHGERLLDILNQKPSLVHRIGRVDIHDGSDLWAWLSSSRALDLLAHLSHAPSLTISADYKAVPEVQTLRKIMSQLVAIKHLEVALFPFRHFLEVCILLSCFQSTLKSLKLGCSVEPPSDYHVDIDDTPYFLAAEALWEHTSPLVFPCLTSITFNWFHCEELADWFVHSGVADQIQAPNIVSDDFYHVDHARSFLSSGCKALRRLSLGMCEDAWELVSAGEDEPIVLPANLTRVDFNDTSGNSCESVMLILLTLPEDNALAEINIEISSAAVYDIKHFEGWLAELDKTLREDRYSEVKRIKIDMGEEYNEIDQARLLQVMSRAVERGAEVRIPVGRAHVS